MVGTKLLYLEDSYLRVFSSKIVASGPRFVVLEATAFYPEGGGQPCDQGWLRCGGEEARVVKVLMRGNLVYHYLDRNLGEVGGVVEGELDWGRRYRHMRLHSCEHLLTGLFEAGGSGPKVFSSFTQLDFQPSELSEGDLEQVWKQYHRVVEEDVPVEVYYVDRSEVDVGGDRRKKAFLEKIPPGGKIRMVRIGEYAETFCRGTHVARTGEIGGLFELRVEPKRKGRKVVYFRLAE